MTAGRRGAEAATVRLATLLVGTFFRAVGVDGADRVPGSGPLVVVANHQNGLVDGLVLIATSPRYPRFLGKSTLWKIWPLRPFLSLAGVVPVYRRADSARLGDEARIDHNRAALARAGTLLADGGTIGVFPEGISHDLAALQDLRSGAARLALTAADAGVDVAVQPVGLVYDDKSHFRSRVLVRFGPARAVADRVDAYRGDPGAAVEALTAAIAADLRAVGPDYDGVTDTDRFVRLAGGPTPRSATRPRHSAPRLIAEGGVTGVGLAVHAVPYAIIKVVGDLAPNRSMRATVKLLGSFGLYSLTYLALAGLVAHRRGPLAGLLALIAAPLSGSVALRTLEAAEERRMDQWRRH